jgi:hypothetical protein
MLTMNCLALFGLCQPLMGSHAAQVSIRGRAVVLYCSMFAEQHSSTPAEFGENQYQASDAVRSLQIIVLSSVDAHVRLNHIADHSQNWHVLVIIGGIICRWNVARQI